MVEHLYFIINFLSLTVQDIWPIGLAMTYRPIDLSKNLACGEVSKGW